ncbi:energy-coupling factor transporter transmembrane component T family protein [Tuwongella immobilis]|nr:energy-coupling factor transporter transmembrane component T [Tuwongella immobilis]
MTLAFEHITPRDSLLARCDARWKLLGILGLTLVVAAMQTLVSVTVALLCALALLLLARPEWRWLKYRFGTVCLSMIPFLILPPLTLPWPRGGIVASMVTLKALAILSLMMALIASTSVHRLAAAAVAVRMPQVLVLLTVLTYRYTFLLAEEIQRIRVALRVRGFRNRGNRHSWKTLGQVIGALLVRGSDRSERVAHAMEARGFDGRFRSLEPFRTRWGDPLLAVGLAGVSVGLVLLEWQARSI